MEATEDAETVNQLVANAKPVLENNDAVVAVENVVDEKVIEKDELQPMLLVEDKPNLDVEKEVPAINPVPEEPNLNVEKEAPAIDLVPEETEQQHAAMNMDPVLLKEIPANIVESDKLIQSDAIEIEEAQIAPSSPPRDENPSEEAPTAPPSNALSELMMDANITITDEATVETSVEDDDDLMDELHAGNFSADQQFYTPELDTQPQKFSSQPAQNEGSVVSDRVEETLDEPVEDLDGDLLRIASESAQVANTSSEAEEPEEIVDDSSSSSSDDDEDDDDEDDDDDDDEDLEDEHELNETAIAKAPPILSATIEIDDDDDDEEDEAPSRAAHPGRYSNEEDYDDDEDHHSQSYFDDDSNISAVSIQDLDFAARVGYSARMPVKKRKVPKTTRRKMKMKLSRNHLLRRKLIKKSVTLWVNVGIDYRLCSF